MAERSGIEWTDTTWNPTTGCDRVSPGCANCYALTLAGRLKAMGSAKYQTDGADRTSGPGFGIAMHDATVSAPFDWATGRRVFVNSMSDLFHDGVTDDFIACVFAVMAATQRHTYQVLTKRHARMRSLLSRPAFHMEVVAWLRHWADEDDTRFEHDADAVEHGARWPLPNVWLGVSVEDQQRADLRIPALLDTPARVRWLSCEPLLGPVDLSHLMGTEYACPATSHDFDCCTPNLIDWVVCGGESGHGARPMHPGWARAVRDQCQTSAVPFLFKQWGAWAPAGFGFGRLSETERYVGAAVDDRGFRQVVRRVGKGAAGRTLDGRTWDEFPGGAR